MQNIAFIGIGVMGDGMVRNLLKAGFGVTVYSRTKAKAAGVLDAGAQWADTIAQCVRSADAVITMVGYPKDVEEVYFSEGGVLQNAKPGACLIDMTTTKPSLAQKIAQEADKLSLGALDAPVSGGDAGAQAGALSIMVGGDAAHFKACRPIFEAMGKTIILEGGPGTGQHTKMANQIAIAGTLCSLCEAIIYAQTVGLDSQAMVDSIANGAAGSAQLNLQAAKILREDYSPGFYMKHFIKDMQIAKEAAVSCGLDLPILDKVLGMFETLQARGLGDLGTQALIRWYRDA